MGSCPRTPKLTKVPDLSPGWCFIPSFCSSVSIGIWKVDTIVSLKRLVLDIQQHFTLFLLFFYQKLMKKIEFCYQNYGLTPLQKSDFLVLWKMDSFVSLKRFVLFIQLHFTLFLAFFHEKCFKVKTECFVQNHGLTLSEISNSGTLKNRTFLSYSPERFCLLI